MKFVCDTCLREYSSRRSLDRHVRERHVENKYYPCALLDCKSKFIRRSYLTTHLRKVHGFDRQEAKDLSKGVVPVSTQSSSTSYTLEEISDNEDFFAFLDKHDAEIEPSVNTTGCCTLLTSDNAVSTCEAAPATTVTLSSSPYHPLIEDISDSDIDLPNTTDFLGFSPISVDSNINNDNCLQQLIDGSDESGDICQDISDFSNIVYNQGDTQSNVSDIVQNSFSVKDGNNNECVKTCDNSETLVTSEDEETSIRDTHNDDNVSNDSFILIESEDEPELTIVTSINLTLTKTERVTNGEVTSVTRSASIGYSEGIGEDFVRNNIQNIFDYVQSEFSEYARFYHDTKHT